VPRARFLRLSPIIPKRCKRHSLTPHKLDLAEQFEGHPLLVTDAVLLEIGNTLARSYKQEAVEIISRIGGQDERATDCGLG
jgi:hypothetical protein